MKKVILVVTMAILFGGIGTCNTLAQQQNEALKRAEAAKAMAKATTNAAVQNVDEEDIANISGIVKVTRDKKTGDTTDLELLTQSGVKFKIVRDNDSRYLEQKSGETVELTGIIRQKDGQKWIMIRKPAVMAPVDDKGAGKVQKKAAAKKEQQAKKPPKKYKFDY
ncbi:MAG: hypothetical protein PHR77_03925 [Kiritimatiellae bacterium]|nr:hypothetical protein [Kiritimatiellia bacterium]MDD5523197.1 hypothetical protein [Kiritimatiellia bacterium]